MPEPQTPPERAGTGSPTDPGDPAESTSPTALGVLGALGALSTVTRGEWRADEEMWMHEAARRWAHGRRITGLLHEYAAHGDRVAVDVAGSTFTGAIEAVGDDRLDVSTPSGTVTIRTATTDSIRALAVPFVLRRTHRARAGGRRLPPALVTFGARLRELEESGRIVRVGTFVTPTRTGGELRGAVVVGADHVLVRGDDDVAVPLAWIAYVAEVSGA